MRSLQGKVVVVTGAAMGIGEGVARRFAREGATVVVADINEGAGRATADALVELGGRGHYLHYDLFDPACGETLAKETMAEFGRIDVLVNNAYPTGLGKTGPMESKPLDFYEKMTRAGYLSIVGTMNAVFPHMQAANFGRIINMCSLNGVNAHKYTSEYNAAKEAVRAYSRTAAVEWMRYGITTNVVCPAAMSEAAKMFQQAEPEMMTDMLKQNPAGRLGDSERDIGGAVLLLASDDAGYINGNTLFVDGGSHVNGVNWSPAGS